MAQSFSSSPGCHWTEAWVHFLLEINRCFIAFRVGRGEWMEGPINFSRVGGVDGREASE